MHTHDLSAFEHEHVFGQDQVRAGERRTLVVVIITVVMMVVEITTGLLFGSMALLADGLHMASHATALGISVIAYIFVRRLAADRGFSFGTGKMNSLAGFGSAVLLAGFAAVMAVESLKRLIDPVAIAFDQALIVAAAGLVVNGASAWILVSTPHHHGHDHSHDHSHAHAQGGHGERDPHTPREDQNLKAAYLHVLADALTSLLAIFALLAGKLFGLNWLDPVMGIVGAALVARWSIALLKETGEVLLDRQADERDLMRVRTAIEGESSDRIADLHLWSIGPGIRAAELTVVSDAPKPVDHYKSLLPEELNIRHATVEIRQCRD